MGLNTSTDQSTYLGVAEGATARVSLAVDHDLDAMDVMNKKGRLPVEVSEWLAAKSPSWDDFHKITEGYSGVRAMVFRECETYGFYLQMRKISLIPLSGGDEVVDATRSRMREVLH